MKKFFLFVFVSFILFGCEGPMGPQGPQGESGNSENKGISIGGNYFEFEPDRTNGIAGIRITNYSGTGDTVVIPNEINGIPVRAIGTGAFREKYLFSITIPNSIIVIGNNAFAGNFLTSVTIPNSVKSIGSSAFQNNLLASVAIPNNVTSMGDYAFYDNLLVSVTIGQNAFSSNFWPFPGAGSFWATYQGVAGTYTRSDVNSSTWTRM